MRKRDRKALAEYVRWVANEMELRDWTISINHEPCDDSCMAEVHCGNGARDLSIAVNRDFMSYGPEYQREVIVHELVHAHCDPAWKMVQSDLGEALGKPVYYVFCDSYRRAMEYQVDALAKTIAKHLPLIEWPDDGHPA